MQKVGVASPAKTFGGGPSKRQPSGRESRVCQSSGHPHRRGSFSAFSLFGGDQGGCSASSYISRPIRSNPFQGGLYISSGKMPALRGVSLIVLSVYWRSFAVIFPSGGMQPRMIANGREHVVCTSPGAPPYPGIGRKRVQCKAGACPRKGGSGWRLDGTVEAAICGGRTPRPREAWGRGTWISGA